jgi:hypothetical protein
MYKFDRGNFQLDVGGKRDGDSDDLPRVPASWFEFQRGDIRKNQGLRLRIQNNTNEMTTDGSRYLTVSDIYDKGRGVYIDYGAQFADYITMSASGVVIPGDQPSAPKSCVLDRNKQAANGKSNGKSNGKLNAPAISVAAPSIGRWTYGSSYHPEI